jgi:hypothetical protein
VHADGPINVALDGARVPRVLVAAWARAIHHSGRRNALVVFAQPDWALFAVRPPSAAAVLRLAVQRVQIVHFDSISLSLSLAYVRAVFPRHGIWPSSSVIIHDAGPFAGGMMHFGIPRYRLPREGLVAEIARIKKLGVEIILNHKVEDLLAEKVQGEFDAVFLAVGAHLSKRHDIPARDAGRIYDALHFLKEAELGGDGLKIGRRVAVYGIPVETYAYNEVRYRTLASARPEEARALMEAAQWDIGARWRSYQSLADRWPAENRRGQREAVSHLAAVADAALR